MSTVVVASVAPSGIAVRKSPETVTFIAFGATSRKVTLPSGLTSGDLTLLFWKSCCWANAEPATTSMAAIAEKTFFI